MKKMGVCIFLFCCMQLSGCTVLGIFADNEIEKEHDRHRQTMEPANRTSDGSFTNAGLEADINIVKKVIKTLKSAEPKVRCEVINKIKICHQEGSEHY